ncbi:uncharacterized protein LOC111627866 [Centruroides sculpturatus]|uniref:uncharacterized protein LOC111627866 n=1 Tax=Centruroides sculpturatus TaxID=218467 RepID=UPI000C6CF928|nr:uncharacterized protein LOC111627866 [Centruroides sculpturatus]XP_023227408.1 uncharacterized protein LOC111627866 [Centruroides sculpturatus]XP_023227477.1 uncharacterized protein LOC111627866 [Centruroides sculpturatus]XP_023227543.1 uncharacterized protein LOC111627866 [Centruroides sculpturatus]
MAEEIEKFKISRLFKRKKKEHEENADQNKNVNAFFNKNGHITRFLNRFKKIKKHNTDDEKYLVKEEEIEIYITSDPAEEKAAKKLAKKEKRKKRMKKIRKVALRSCHYIGMGVASMAPPVIYQSPTLENNYDYDDYRYCNYRYTANSSHWTTGIVFANW